MTKDEQIAALRPAVSTALALLTKARAELVDLHSDFELVDGEQQTIPDSLDPEVDGIVAEYDAAIQQCEAAIEASEGSGR